MKNILLLAHDDPGQEARFQAALDLARALDGHLICLDVTDVPIVYGEPYTGTVQEATLLADLRERESANREWLEARLAREGVSWTWIDVTGAIAPSLQNAGRMADIIVVNRRLDSSSFEDMRGIAAELVIGSGKAVAAIPEHAKGFQAAGRALIAWDGSNEAVKALQVAVPLLQLAGTVTIVEVEDGVRTSAEEAAAYLSRHGIRPVFIQRRGRGASVAATLLAEAKSGGADYVVMGGFGHSRIIEAIFGGVSREMLTESPIPVVMAH